MGHGVVALSWTHWRQISLILGRRLQALQQVVRILRNISNLWHYKIACTTYMTERQSAPATVFEAAWLVALLPPDLNPGLIYTAIFSGVANG